MYSVSYLCFVMLNEHKKANFADHHAVKWRVWISITGYHHHLLVRGVNRRHSADWSKTRPLTNMILLKWKIINKCLNCADSAKFRKQKLFFCSRWRSGSRTAGPKNAKSTRRSSSSQPPPQLCQQLLQEPATVEVEEVVVVAASMETVGAALLWWQAAVAAMGSCPLPPCPWTSKRSTEEDMLDSDWQTENYCWR